MRRRQHQSSVVHLVPPSADEFERAFDAMVHEHYERLCNFAYRYLGGREAAEDAVHDVLLNVWKRREHLHAETLRGYLFRSVYNQCGVFLRQRRVRAESDLERAGDEALTVPEGEDRELIEAVARAVDALPQRCRLIFTMNREQGLTYREIAETLGVSPSTVDTQMGRALKSLRARLAGLVSILVAIGLSG